MFKRPSVLYAVIAAAALSVGLLVYLLGRQPEHVYFLFHGFSLGHGHHSLFGALGNYLPSFVHVYAFILLTVVVAGSSNARLLRSCTAWFFIASLFEYGQHPAVSPIIAAALPVWFARVPVLDNIAAYFLNGTFDLLDFLALAAGTVAACLTVVLIRNRAGPRPSDNPMRSVFRFLAMSGLMLTGMLTIIGSGGDGTAVPGPATVGSHLYVSGNGNDALLAYNDANSVSGSTAASRTVTGGLTTLNAPRGIAVDMTRNQMYVANTSADAILVFNSARSATGNIAPNRTIAGAATTLSGPSALFFDVFNDRLYVANTDANAILVFDNASTANGNVAPSRTLTGAATTLNAPYGVFVDITRNKLYVINSGVDSILVFNNAATVSGNTAPSRTISGAATTMSGPSGGALDMLQDRLYVANTGSNSILVFNAISVADGNLAPNRTIAGVLTGLNQPRDLYLDLAGDRLYVANAVGNSILMFDGASSVTGATAPDRTLSLAAGTIPYGIFVDVTPVVVGSSAALDGEAGSDVTATSAGGGPRTGDVEDLFTSTAYRQFYSFDLLNIPAGTSVAAATLRLYQASVSGSPYGGALGDVVVDHMNYGTSLDGTDYAAGALLSNIGMLSSDDSAGYKTLGVASRVQNDLDNGRVRSQYRLRFSLLNANLDTSDDYAQFTDAEDSCCGVNKPPQLLITFSP
jgi:DNA-binding beta-propeller fold protein YncE